MKDHLVRDAEGLAECLQDIASSPRIGFDTEFVGEYSYVPELCLIQVATARALYVIDPYCFDSLDDFWELLVDPDRQVVVHAGREEIRMCRHAIGKTPPNLFDVQIAAALLGYGFSLGFAAINQNVIRKTVKKGETLTDWRKRPLTTEQLRYAFDDVRTLLALWKKLDAELRERNRLEWAEDEFRDFVEHAQKEPIEVERWRKLKGVASLSSEKLALVRAVYLWRENMAERRNRPARSILRDDLVIEIAKKNPRTEDDLSSLRGLGKSDVGAILQSLHEARQLPPQDWPVEAERDNDPQAVQLSTNLLNVVLADWCARNDLTTPIVATSSDIRELVRCAHRGEPLPEDSPLNRGWRREHLLPILQEVLMGQRALRIKSLHATSPFEYGAVRPTESASEKSSKQRTPRNRKQ